MDTTTTHLTVGDSPDFVTCSCGNNPDTGLGFTPIDAADRSMYDGHGGYSTEGGPFDHLRCDECRAVYDDRAGLEYAQPGAIVAALEGGSDHA